jgi:signal transduction histidine kinase
MKLSVFINGHMEEILAEWESFARTLEPAAATMSALALRDHAKMILKAMALDIESTETPDEQYEKSRGMAPDVPGGESAAATHGTLRHESGFSLIQLTAEYRALRATVLRLWLPHVTHVTDASTKDMIRFNETIDQALAESVLTYSERATSTRDTFLAILGHDLRSPLATIAMSGTYLVNAELDSNRIRVVGGRVLRSAATMTSMVDDLLEYARTQLGGEIPVVPQLANMREICQLALDDASAAHPDCAFELHDSGNVVDYFDSSRMQQVFSNLLNNAAQYRSKDCSVLINVNGEPDAVNVEVRNRGPVIPAESIHAIFDPLVQLSVTGQDQGRPSSSIGLGLFIAREITIAHGGTITVESSEASGTVFTVRLPRAQASQQ